MLEQELSGRREVVAALAAENEERQREAERARARDEMQRYKQSTQKTLMRILKPKAPAATGGTTADTARLPTGMAKAKSHKPALTQRSETLAEETFLEKVKKEYITQKRENEQAAAQISEHMIYMEESKSPEVRRGRHSPVRETSGLPRIAVD